MNPADEHVLRDRFAALAGADDGDWGDVRRRARRRVGKLVVAVAALVVALGAAGLAIGGEVIGLFGEHGKRVPLSSFPERDREMLVTSMCRHLEFENRPGRAPAVVCRDGNPKVEEIASDGFETHWRVRYPWGLTCLASGRVGGYHNPNHGNRKIGSFGCNAGTGGRKLVPTPERPITVDAMMGSSRDHPEIQLLRVSGLAGRGVGSVGLVAKDGPRLTTRVRGYAYSFRKIPDRLWIAIAAYDEHGKEVYRERLYGLDRPPPALHPEKAKIWAPGPPTRPRGEPLQHAATADVLVDVYRNGVVEVQFASATSEPYRRLVRSAENSGGAGGITCFTVAYGAGRWRVLGGGSNAGVGREMGARIGNFGGAFGGMPSAPFDACEVYGTYGRYWNDEEGPRELVEVPFNAIGRRFFDERATARDLAYFVRTRKLRRIRLAIHRGEPGPSAAELARTFGERVVPMAHRGGTAPNGKVGVWTDGKLIVATELTPGGRRLYVTVRDVFIGANNIRDLSFPF